MAPLASVRIQALDARLIQRRTGPTSQTLNPVYIVGIVLACSAIALLAVWMAVKRRGKSRLALKVLKMKETEKDAIAASASKQAESASVPPPPVPPRLHPPSIYVTSADDIAKCVQPPDSATSKALPSPPPPYGAGGLIRPHSLGRHTSTGSLDASNNRMSSATLTEHELIDYHLGQGPMPVAFAPATIHTKSESSKYPFATEKSRVQSIILPPLSAGPMAHTPQHSATNPGHSRLSSLSASIRHSLFSHRSSPPSSPTKSIFNFGIARKPFRRPSTIPSPTDENQRTIVITSFSPLLPDELVLTPGKEEKVTVLETYDDGWCIVARTNMGMLEVGAVPEWVFGIPQDEDESFGTMRPMRSTSLGVTVDLRVVEDAGDERPQRHWALAMTEDRGSIISWSNF